MAKYYDIDTAVRINGGLTVNGDVIIPSTYGLDAGTGTIKASIISGGTLKGDGSAITNLSSSAMTDVLKLDGSRYMTGRVMFNVGSGNTSGLYWNANTDSASIYANSDRGSDLTDLIFKMGDNTTGDRFVFWFADYRGSSYDSYPLIMDGVSATFGVPLTISGNANISGNINTSGLVDGVDIAAFKSSYDTHNHDSRYLGISAKAVDSDKLDGLDSSQFVRNDTSGSIKGVLTTNQSLRGTFDSSGDFLRMNNWLPNKLINGNGEWNNGFGWTVLSGNAPTTAHEAESGRYLFIQASSKIQQDVYSYQSNTLSISYSTILGTLPIYLTIQELSNNKATVIATPVNNVNIFNKSGVINFSLTGGNGPDGSAGRYVRIIIENTDNVTAKRTRFWINFGSNAFMSYGLEEDFYTLTNMLFDNNWDLKSNGYKVWHSGNDGSGSGLDADLLDGLDSTAFARSGYGLGTAAQQVANGTDINTLKTTGFFRVNAGVNVPPRVTGDNTGIWHYIEVIRHDDSWIVQNAWEYTTGTMFTRTLYGTGTWSPWKKVWTVDTDGTGSGLDADTIDGLNSTQFMRNDISNTISGNMTFDDSSEKQIKGSSLNAGIYINSANMGLYDWKNSRFIFAYNQSANTFNINGTPTINNYKIWHSGNMGASSGLDADKIDGLDSSQFLRSDADDTTTGLVTVSRSGDGIELFKFNTERPWSFFQTGTGAGTALDLRSSALDKSFIISDPSGNAAFEFRISSGIPYMNINSNTVWHAGNDGSGSGLDADKLDGIDSSQFMRNDANNTISGDIVISKNAPKLKLYDANVASGNYATIEFDSQNNQGVQIRFNEFDGELPENGYGLILERNATNTQTNYKTLLSVEGNIYSDGNIVWHSGNMGANSGLDADLLDGLQTVGTSGNSSLLNRIPYIKNDSVMEIGKYLDFHDTSSTFVDYDVRFIVTGASANGGGTINIATNGTNGLQVNGSKVWHQGNDGSGSGLDADTVDGIQASQFLRNDTVNTSSSDIKFNALGTTYPIAIDLTTIGSGTGWARGIQPIVSGSVIGGAGFYGTGQGVSSFAVKLSNNWWVTPNLEVLSTGVNINGNKVWHQGNDGSGSGLDADLLDGLDSSKFARGSTATYSSVSGDDGTDGWYTLFTVNDTSTSPILCSVKAYAHTSALFAVSKGYSTSGAMIALLQANITNNNGGYKYLKGIRILNDGSVQLKLNGGATVQISAQILSNGSDTTLVNTLTKDTSSPTVTQSIDPLVNGSIVSYGNMYVGSNVVWNAGNDGSGSGLDADLLDGIDSVKLVRNDVTNQIVQSGFTISGTAYVGNSTGKGNIIIRTGSGDNGIQLAGDNSAELSGVGSYINAQGNAKFNGTVQVGTLLVDTTTLVSNLNAEMVGGLNQSKLAKNESVSELGGKGVYSGLNVTAQTIPNMSVLVKAGTGYTNSGMRFTYTDYSVSLAASDPTYDRIDAIYIKGSSAVNNEGDISYMKGTASATPVTPNIPSDAYMLATIYVRKNIGTIQNADITDVRNWKPFKTIYGNAELWTDLLVQTGTITSSKNNYVEFGKPIKSPAATSLTFNTGDKSKTWTHNFGLANYAVKISVNSFEPHVRWTNKLANSVTIELDDVCEDIVIVDVSIEAY